jgi:type II secretory pathway pseudopilin PulG
MSHQNTQKPKTNSSHGLGLMTHDCSRGMTLVETVVWVSITSMLLLAIVQSVQYFYRTNTYAVEQGAAITSAQRGIENMIKTMREAAYSSNGAWPIIAMSTTSFAFYADVDDDPFIEQIRFYLAGDSLMRGVIDPSGDPPVYTNPEQVSTISDNVRNTDQDVILFRYYDVDGNLMVDLTKIAEVRFVQATVVVNINPFRLPNQFTLRSTAALRNLK